MEAFLPYVLPLVLLPVSLYLISFLHKNGSSKTKNHPPGSKGWPMLGENLEVEKYSPEVFRTTLLGEKMAIFCGAQGNKLLFTNENKLLTSWWPQSVKKALLFPEFLSRPQPEALKQYIPVMDALAHEHMDHDWKPNSIYTFKLACRLFLCVTDPEHIKKLANPFSLVTNGMFSVPIYLPGTAYNRAIKEGKMVREELKNIIKGRRKDLIENNETEGQDLMEISNSIVGLLVASFETTSSTVTSVMNYLASLPHIYEEVLKEHMEIAKSKGPDELLTYEDIEKMKYSWNVARESLRLTPPAGSPMPPPYTFVPFGGRPRMCPGKEYARLEILVFMHNVVKMQSLMRRLCSIFIVLLAIC
ncbi:hypothetical protein ACJIZ3_005675 [Penstemon smallii]|uniref:Cytochrome P450 n=1 Tax=Penstemon smallii TaxID=265156 RepID=A0ABD3S5J9_9LAMI